MTTAKSKCAKNANIVRYIHGALTFLNIAERKHDALGVLGALYQKLQDQNLGGV